jgi:hypothetical protein
LHENRERAGKRNFEVDQNDVDKDIMPCKSSWGADPNNAVIRTNNEQDIVTELSGVVLAGIISQQKVCCPNKSINIRPRYDGLSNKLYSTRCPPLKQSKSPSV